MRQSLFSVILSRSVCLFVSLSVFLSLCLPVCLHMFADYCCCCGSATGFGTQAFVRCLLPGRGCVYYIFQHMLSLIFLPVIICPPLWWYIANISVWYLVAPGKKTIDLSIKQWLLYWIVLLQWFASLVRCAQVRGGHHGTWAYFSASAALEFIVILASMCHGWSQWIWTRGHRNRSL